MSAAAVQSPGMAARVRAVGVLGPSPPDRVALARAVADGVSASRALAYGVPGSVARPASDSARASCSARAHGVAGAAASPHRVPVAVAPAQRVAVALAGPDRMSGASDDRDGASRSGPAAARVASGLLHAPAGPVRPHRVSRSRPVPLGPAGSGSVAARAAVAVAAAYRQLALRPRVVARSADRDLAIPASASAVHGGHFVGCFSGHPKVYRQRSVEPHARRPRGAHSQLQPPSSGFPGRLGPDWSAGCVRGGQPHARAAFGIAQLGAFSRHLRFGQALCATSAPASAAPPAPPAPVARAPDSFVFIGSSPWRPGVPVGWFPASARRSAPRPALCGRCCKRGGRVAGFRGPRSRVLRAGTVGAWYPVAPG